MPRLPLLLPLTLLFLAACDPGDPDDGNPPPADEIVAGVNLTALFRTPTPQEIASVEAEWSARDPRLNARYLFELAAERTAPDGADLRVYRALSADSGTALFHGAVRLPPRPPGDVRQRPLVLVLPDGDTGTSVDVLTDGSVPLYATDRDAVVLALLAYRGAPLDVEGEAFASAAPSRPYDADADDALAFLAHVRGLGASALVDPARVGVVGLGRGGGVALLTEPRTGVYDVVVDLAGPTDLFNDTFRAQVRALLEGGPGGAFPGLEALASEIVYPLRDGAITPERARFELLLRSPRYFAGPPPFFVVAHGSADTVVPVQHSRVLDLTVTSQNSSGVYLELEEVTHDALAGRPQVVSLVSTQLHERLGF